MAFRLAELFVEFTTKGVQSVQTALGTVHKSLEQVQSGAAAVGRVAQYAFGAASLAVGGFVRSGIGASAVGDQLHFQMERLSRTVAGLFGPEIRKVIDYIGQLNDRFASLTDQQREQIANWVKAAATGLAVAIVLPRIIGGVSALVGGIRAMTVAFGVMNASTGGILVVLGAVVTALAGMGAAATVGEGGIGALTGSFQGLLTAAQDVFARIAVAMQPVFAVGQQLFEALKPLLASLAEMFVKLVEAIAPVVAVIGEALIPLIQMLTVVVSVLSAMLNENTMQWFAAVAAFTAVIVIVPRIITAISSLITALRSLTIAQIIQKAMSGPAGWAQLATGAAIAAVAVGAAAMAYSKVGEAAAAAGKKAEDATKKAIPGRGPLTPKIGGMEALDAAYARIAQATLTATAGLRSREDEILDLAREQGRDIGVIRRRAEEGKPVFAN